MVALLNKKLQKDQLTSFLSTIKVEKDAVEDLSIVSRSPWVITLPRATAQYRVDTDAVDFQMGYVLLRKQVDGRAQSVRYGLPTIFRAQ